VEDRHTLSTSRLDLRVPLQWDECRVTPSLTTPPRRQRPALTPGRIQRGKGRVVPVGGIGRCGLMRSILEINPDNRTPPAIYEEIGLADSIPRCHSTKFVNPFSSNPLFHDAAHVYILIFPLCSQYGGSLLLQIHGYGRVERLLIISCREFCLGIPIKSATTSPLSLFSNCFVCSGAPQRESPHYAVTGGKNELTRQAMDLNRETTGETGALVLSPRPLWRIDKYTNLWIRRLR
jgi:hypothetical protein